eukprot:c2591_g1_i1 orf=82-801(+)
MLGVRGVWWNACVEFQTRAAESPVSVPAAPAHARRVAVPPFHITPLGLRSPSSSRGLLCGRVHGVIRRSSFFTELDADEEEQVYALEPSEQLQGGINHLMFMLEVLSHIKEFEAVIPNSGQNPPWCGDGDRFFVDNQKAIAQALANAHTAWDRLSGSKRRAWKGSLVGMAFSIEAMEDGELVAGIMSKADYQLLYSALTPGMTAKRMVSMMDEEDLKRADIFTVAIYARNWLEMFVPQW